MKTGMKSLMTALALSLFTFAVIPAAADGEADEARALVTRSLWTLEDFVAHPDMDWFRYELKYAKAVLIIPTLGKGGFILGGYGGSGCMLARDEESDEWSYPAF